MPEFVIKREGGTFVASAPGVEMRYKAISTLLNAIDRRSDMADQDVLYGEIASAVRKFWEGYVEERAKLIGTHDPELDAARGRRAQLEALLVIFDTCSAAFGELPHEQPVRATIVTELNNLHDPDAPPPDLSDSLE